MDGHRLTESFNFIEADRALVLSLLDAAQVVNVITFEEPHLLPVPLAKVELMVTVVAAGSIVDDTHAAVIHQIAKVTLHFFRKDEL